MVSAGYPIGQCWTKKQFSRTCDSLLAIDVTEGTLPPSSSAAKAEEDGYAGTGDPPALPSAPPLALLGKVMPPISAESEGAKLQQQGAITDSNSHRK